MKIKKLTDAQKRQLKKNAEQDTELMKAYGSATSGIFAGLAMLVLIGLMLLSAVIEAIPVLADEDNSSENYLISEDIKGVYSDSIDSLSVVQTETDFNWDAGEILMNVQRNTIHIEIPALGENISFDLEMYPSKMGMDNQNRMIGIETEKTTGRYSIIRFIIEKNTSYLYLVEPNLDLLGKTVVHLGVVDNTTGEIYVMQFEESQFDYDTMYSNLSNGNYTDTELVDVELGYFSMQTQTERKRSFSDVEDMSVSGSFSASIYTTQKNGEWTEEVE